MNIGKSKLLFVLILVSLLIIGIAVFSFVIYDQSGIPTSSTSGFSSLTSSNTSLDHPTVTLTDSMPLPRVGERFDHIALDIQDQLVLIAARGNNSVYVANLITEGTSHIITGLDESQGVVFSRYDRLYVSNGGNGAVDVFDVRDFKLLNTLILSPNAGDADNMRYDPSTGLLYVGYGEENQSGIGIINTTSDTVVGSIPLNGHPEAFEVEQNGTRIFVNVPTANSIEVVDKVTRKLIGSCPLPGNETENFPMALDEADHRLFVGFWSPSMLFVYDTQSGNVVASLAMPQDADDLFYDSNSRLILASCGRGSLFVLQQTGINSYETLLTLPTRPLGRTSLFYPQQEEIFVAVPQHDGLSAQLMTFSIGK
ncbi:MAG TPA: hypothetical protein VFF30_02190 [Nitrososphaerales archaeon]|nr:hypothetical protein [Nitrososphaerales archaeon]